MRDTNRRRFTQIHIEVMPSIKYPEVDINDYDLDAVADRLTFGIDDEDTIRIDAQLTQYTDRISSPLILMSLTKKDAEEVIFALQTLCERIEEYQREEAIERERRESNP